MADILKDGTTERPGMPEAFHLKLSSFNLLVGLAKRGLVSDTSRIWVTLVEEGTPEITANNLRVLFGHVTESAIISDRESLTRLVNDINEDPNVVSANKRIGVLLSELLTSVNS